MALFKNPTDIRYFREAARIAGYCCDMLVSFAQPGMNTSMLEMEANRLLARHRASAPFKRFGGFGYAICVSLNDEIVNGPPDPNRILQDGDVLSVAIGSEYRGFYGKAARTVYLGDTPPEAVIRLLQGTRGIFDRIRAHPDIWAAAKDLSQAMLAIAAEHQLKIIENSGGMAIGKKLHEIPLIPNYPEQWGEDVPLVPGFSFTLMPMMTLGANPAIRCHENGWTHLTSDGALAAHFADTLLVTPAGLEIISQDQA